MTTRERDRLAKAHVPPLFLKPQPGERCPRCHRRRPPERCALCAPVVLPIQIRRTT